MLELREHGDGIREIRLARPPVNALNPELVAALHERLTEAQDDGTAGIVLSGAPGLFSAGLDLPELLELDRDGMREFWRSLFGVLETLAKSRVPVVSALTGHSPAGGTVIALFSDYRIMAEGDFRLGLNEVQVGLVVPPVIHKALARLVGPYPAERHLVAGRMIRAEEAMELGLVDELQPADEVVDRALEWCRELLALPRHSMTATRELVRSDLGDFFGEPGALDVDGFADFWFRDETQATLRHVVDQLKNKGKPPAG
ncbi:MAG: enoyl-CoA hydratase/isomerase family protein [Wenzhouxiangellaceae bacterium]|nr:enoyl-CoA hydratase/isomerase family protein [Wenzhouxiangellaceae bacterium]